MGAREVTVVVVVTTVVVVVAGANENWPMVACESRDFGRLRAPWPWLLEAMSGSAPVCLTCEGEYTTASRLFVYRPVWVYARMDVRWICRRVGRMSSRVISCRGGREAQV